jgi:hypothetical protein
MISDQDLVLKEQELKYAMEQYHNFDMTQLKQEIESTFNQEASKIQKDFEFKQQEIQMKFRTITKLSSQHLG